MASVSRETMERGTSKPISAHSTFKNGYPLAGSYRFGQIQPHFVQEVVPDDDIEMSSAYKLDSYTLSQPLMQDMFITHGYYFVPLSALLPLNYEKFITNPVIGEDINPETIGLSYDFNRLKQVFVNISNLFDDAISDAYAEPTPLSVGSAFAHLLRWVLAYDMIYGLGGLPATLGYKFISDEQQNTFDSILDTLQSNFFSYDLSVSVIVQGQTSPTFDNLHQLLEFLRDDFNFELSVSSSSLSGIVPILDDIMSSLVSTGPGSSNLIPSLARPVNMARILSYQVVCAHFFTNDKIDYIYSAELYRQNVYSAWCNGTAILEIYGSPFDETFLLNGERYRYDYLSSFFFNFDSSTNFDAVIGDLQYLRLLFGFNNSLRHVDYFTGTRSHPLAVGDVGVQVNNGVVDVVDTIQTTWFAKFLNQVNRTGRRMSAYIKGLFPDAALSQDWHEPLWLADATDKIMTAEVENTGEAQTSEKNSITSTLQSNSNRYAFRYHNSQYYGVIIGVCYFDIERFYTQVTERQNFHIDRFDMFNPFLQFNGDQEVYAQELQVGKPIDFDNFGYQSRYLEYKQRVPQCFGAFITDPVLSKSIFLADVEKRDIQDYYLEHISPSYIRSHPLEFDRFYLSLTGLSLASYYHFQIIHWNRVKSVRPMVFNPQLG